MSARAVTLAALVTLAACKREERALVPPAAEVPAPVLSPMSPLRPGPAVGDLALTGDLGPMVLSGARVDQSAWATGEGQRLFNWFNCAGCHAQGGGGMGPPLMDGAWRYGSAPADVFRSIVQGRPNGMPSFRGRIDEYQVWQLVAYVRSLSGLLRRDVEPSRSDTMAVKEPESRRPPQPPHREVVRP